MNLEDVLNALDRQARNLETQADKLMRELDYSAEFPAQDALALQAAARMLRAHPHVAASDIPEVTSQEDEAFQALPAMTADEMRGAEGMSDQMNWAFDQATHDMHVRVAEGMADLADQMEDFSGRPLRVGPVTLSTQRFPNGTQIDMHVRVAEGMADLADQMDGVFKPTPCPSLAPQVEEMAAGVFAGMRVTVDPTMPPDEIRFEQGGKLVGRIVNAAPPHDSLEEAQMAAGWPQEAQPATVPAAPPVVDDDEEDGTFYGYVPADSKPTNPKDAVGDTRVPLSLLSPIAKAHWALAQHCGRTKYGAWNWREAGARASVYISAIQRHADGYLSGETNDPADGTHHLGNIMACCAILLEAEAAGKLQDDRPPVVGIREVYAAVEKQQAVLTAKYADRRPRHWTIGDAL